MQDFLLELGFEELPARFVEAALAQLKDGVLNKLSQARLSHGEVLEYSTPRRLTLLIQDLQIKQEDLVEEVKGPPVNIAQDEHGNLTKAGQGFLRSQGVDAGAVTIKDFQGGDYLFITKEVAGQETATLLKPLLEEVITGLNFPKNMRWGNYDLRFARPLRWIVALFAEEKIPLTVGPITGGNVTWGHRQLSSGAITITKPSDYLANLEQHYVLADATKREALIWEQVKNLAKAQGGQVENDPRLLQEVVNLVEYPTAFCGSFAAEYLSLPSEVLVTSMKEHQRYFPIYSATGELLPYFIGVRNGADNHLNTVIRGNEKVLEARLADAKFFYDEDLQIKLDQNVSELDRVVFQDGLGSMGEKVQRIQRLASKISINLGFEEHAESISRTAFLAKADLVTQMVNEFPELQGIIGEKYARAQGEQESVAQGIGEHYLPRFTGDTLPSSIEGTLVSLADKLDTLVGYFALGRIPTGSQDPFALRRQAQGIVQILLQKKYHLSLKSFIDMAAEGYIDVSLDHEHRQVLVDFFLARLRVLLLDQGYAYDILDAVLASGDDRIPHLLARVQALSEFRQSDAFGDLSTGFERIYNLAKKGVKAELVAEEFEQADQNFFMALQDLKKQTETFVENGEYQAVLESLASLRTQIDQFFAEVMIMAENPVIQNNRLALLYQALNLYLLCGDLSKIVISK